MNAAHLHLITNHIPIIGLFCGLFVLICGMVSKNKSVLTISMLLIALCSAGGMVANKSGEEAEDTVEQIAGISKSAIHEHEEAAEAAVPFILLSFVFSATGLFLHRKNHKWAGIANILLLVVCLLACSLSARAGWLGGKIRHQAEIGAIQPAMHHDEKDHD